MRSLGPVLLMTVTLFGCSRAQVTPPAVDAEYRALLETVGEELPGATVQRLRDFTTRYREFDIVPEVEVEIERLRSLADGRYSDARELARSGDYDRAEAVLQDLATYLGDTSDGKSAQEHLAFDFYYGQAQALMVRQRWAEARDLARPLLDRDLTRAQADQVEAILDAAGYVGAAYSEATRGQARAATRQIVIFLEMTYADEGQYPMRLSLSDVADWDPVGSRGLLRGLSAIEDYERDDSGFSFTAVSAEGQHRIRVVDGVIEE